MPFLRGVALFPLPFREGARGRVAKIILTLTPLLEGKGII